MTTHLFVERPFDPPLQPADVMAMAAEATDCFDIHRVRWHLSMLCNDGRRMLCWFSAADAESTRIAMRHSGLESAVAWRGTIHDAPNIDPQEILHANVLVERRFDEPLELQKIQDIEDAGWRCLKIRRVRFLRTYFALDQKRMICLYAAPDAESVRQAQREAGVPFEDAWAFGLLGPADPVDVSC